MSEEFGEALASSDTVAVVGVGNVALDCARILAKGEKVFTPGNGRYLEPERLCAPFTGCMHRLITGSNCLRCARTAGINCHVVYYAG